MKRKRCRGMTVSPPQKLLYVRCPQRINRSTTSELTHLVGRMERKLRSQRMFPAVFLEAMTDLGWSRQSDSNRRPADYKSAALPTELYRHLIGKPRY
jgi:hypothetical protein